MAESKSRTLSVDFAMNIIKYMVLLLAGIFLSGCQIFGDDPGSVFINIFAGVPSQIGHKAANAGNLDYMVNWNGKKVIYEIDGEKFIHAPVEVWERDFSWIKHKKWRFIRNSVERDAGKVWMKVSYQNIPYSPYTAVTAQVTEPPKNLAQAKIIKLSNLRYGDRSEWEWETNYFNRQLLYTQREKWGYWVCPLAVPGYIVDVPLTLAYSLALDTLYVVTFPLFWRLYTGKQEWR